jgi:hypothetical protein
MGPIHLNIFHGVDMAAAGLVPNLKVAILKSHRPAKGLLLFCARACVEKTHVTGVAIITDIDANSAIQPGFFIEILHRPKDMPVQE